VRSPPLPDQRDRHLVEIVRVVALAQARSGAQLMYYGGDPA
jgi:hypothetical protein